MLKITEFYSRQKQQGNFLPQSQLSMLNSSGEFSPLESTVCAEPLLQYPLHPLVKTVIAAGEFSPTESTVCAEPLLQYPLHPLVKTVIAAAYERPPSFCQKCKWQFTAKDTHTLRHNDDVGTRMGN